MTIEEVADAAVRLARSDDGERAIRQLQELAGGRACLEAVRDSFVGRLHRRADDYDATLGLRLVIGALQRTPETADDFPAPAKLNRRIKVDRGVRWNR